MAACRERRSDEPIARAGTGAEQAQTGLTRKGADRADAEVLRQPILQLQADPPGNPDRSTARAHGQARRNACCGLMLNGGGLRRSVPLSGFGASAHAGERREDQGSGKLHV
jgi:hypothetical protein